MDKFISNSQHADDYIAWQILGKKRGGTVVEVGAFDGVHLSNSLGLNNIGWNSICIEPNPEIFNYLKKNRPNSININKAIVGDDTINEIDFFSEEIGVLSGCDYDEEDIKRRYKNRGLEYKEPKKIKVKASTLNAILSDLNLNTNVVDLVSIDVEGFELEVLKGLSLETYNINLFIIEANNDVEKRNILKYFKDYSSYIYIGNNFQNLFIARKGVIKKRNLRKLDFNNFTKAKQHHPISDKLTLDSVYPSFNKSKQCEKFEKYFNVF